MITHPTEEQLNDYVDGRLKGTARDSVSQHLLDCRQCQRSVAAIEEVVEEAHLARDSVTAPAELWPLVAATTVHEAIVRRHVLKRMWPQLSFLVAVLMLLSAAAGVLGTRMAMQMDHALAGAHTTQTRVFVSGNAAPDAPAAPAPLIAIGSGGSGGVGFGGKAIAMKTSPVDPTISPSEAWRKRAHRRINELQAQEFALLTLLETDARKRGWKDFRVAAEERLSQSDRELKFYRDAYLGAAFYGDASDEKTSLEKFYQQRATALEWLLSEGREAWVSNRTKNP